MLLKLVGAALCTVVLLLCGLLGSQLFEKKNCAEPSFLGLIMKGSMLLTVYLGALSFFSPLYLVSVVPPCAAALCFRSNRLYVQSLPPLLTRSLVAAPAWKILAPFAVFLVALLIPSVNVDSAMYHIPSVEFFHDYPLITGLANINEQVAVNSSVFLLNAPFSRLFGPQQGIYPINTVWIVAFTWWLLRSPSLVFIAFRPVVTAIILFYCYRSWLVNINSPSNDPISGMLILYVMLQAFGAAVQRRWMALHQFVYLAVLVGWGLSVKLNTVPLLGALAVMLFYLKRQWVKAMLVPLVCAVPMLVIWMARTYTLSGYLVFPFLKAPWARPLHTIPDIISAYELFFLKMGPKYSVQWAFPFNVVPLNVWLPHWLRQQMGAQFNWGFVLLCAAGLSILLLPFLLHKSGRRSLLGPWAVAVVAAATWLVTSPDYRFAYAWLLACCLPLAVVWVKKIPASGANMGAAGLLLHAMMLLYFTRSILLDPEVNPHVTLSWAINAPKTTFQLKRCQGSDSNSIVLYNTPITPISNTMGCYDNTPWLWRYARTGLKARGSKITDGFYYDGDDRFLPGTFSPKIFDEQRQQFIHQPLR
jgi:hypothetical protein